MTHPNVRVVRCQDCCSETSHAHLCVKVADSVTGAPVDAVLAALAEAGVLEVELWRDLIRYRTPWKEAK